MDKELNPPLSERLERALEMDRVQGAKAGEAYAGEAPDYPMLLCFVRHTSPWYRFDRPIRERLLDDEQTRAWITARERVLQAGDRGRCPVDLDTYWEAFAQGVRKRWDEIKKEKVIDIRLTGLGYEALVKYMDELWARGDELVLELADSTRIRVPHTPEFVPWRDH